MLNKAKHHLIMGQILREMYMDVSISSLLGLKGGTSAYFFYNLPRFSVDLDFDLLIPTEKNQKMIYKKITRILEKYGKIKDSHMKRFTIFALLSYGDRDHNIKVEINIRQIISDLKNQYELKEYLGIPMLVAKKDYLFAGKLTALTSRSETAMRDVYDVDFFAKNSWDINKEVIQSRTGKSIKGYLGDCITYVENIENARILQGLGELLSEKEKAWARTHLKADAIFMLKNYESAMKD